MNDDHDPTAGQHPSVAPPAAASTHTGRHPVPRRSAWATWLLLLLALGSGIGLCVLFVEGRRTRAQSAESLGAATRAALAEPKHVSCARVELGPTEFPLVLPGTAEAFFQTTIYARTSGFVKRWFVDIGDTVTEGQLMALIDTPELDDQLTAALAKRESLDAEVKLAQSAVEFARVSFARWEAAAPDGSVSHQERDQKKAELDSCNAKLDVARAQLKLGDAEVGRLNTLISFKKVVAPFDGTVTARHVDVGALVTAGSTTSTTPMFRVEQFSRVRVFVDVPQVVIAELPVGMATTVTAREFPGVTFEGKMERTAESLNQARTLRTEIVVPNTAHLLKPGMYVQATFRRHRATPPFRVPAAAITLHPTPQVVTVGSDGCASYRDVRIVQDIGDVVEVSGELAEGTLVALNVGSDLANGEHVVVQYSKASDAIAPASQGSGHATHSVH